MKQKHTWLYAILLLVVGLATTQRSFAQTSYTVAPNPENWDCGLDLTMRTPLLLTQAF